MNISSIHSVKKKYARMIKYKLNNQAYDLKNHIPIFSIRANSDIASCLYQDPRMKGKCLV